MVSSLNVMAMMMKLITKKMVMGTMEEAMGTGTATKKTATAMDMQKMPARTEPNLPTELVNTAITCAPTPTKRQARTTRRRHLTH